MKVTAADVARNFGQFADKALTEPVSITKYGREHLVLLSADEYARLKRRDRHVYRTGEMPADLMDAIRSAEPPAKASQFDHEYTPKTES